MNKGQMALGLVILGVVTIIAVIGLVLLFTRASAEGAAILNAETQGMARLRTPVFMIKGESANFLARSDCEKSIKLSGVLSSSNTFNCYALPPERTSDAISYRTVSVACYSNNIGNQENDYAVRDQIISSLDRIRAGSHPDISWTTTMMNGERLAVCEVSGRPT